jgi:Rrf2 family cysteine metabolism transcriptional repressor
MTMRTTLFSAKTEYACIAMLELAAQFGDAQPVRLKSIADAHEIPERFLVQILLQLKGSGLVISTRGAAGGYVLAKSPDQISIADIVGVIDREGRAERAHPDKKKPPPKIDNMPQTSAVQAVRGLWRDVETAQRRLLEKTTLSELLRRAQDNFALSYTI